MRQIAIPFLYIIHKNYVLVLFIVMKLSGSYQIKLEKQKVWEALNDPEILKKSIPRV